MKTQLKNCSQFLLQCVMIYGTNLTPFGIVRLFRILKQFRNQNSTNSTYVPARYVAFFPFFYFFFRFKTIGLFFFFWPSFKIKPTYLVYYDRFYFWVTSLELRLIIFFHVNIRSSSNIEYSSSERENN